MGGSAELLANTYARVPVRVDVLTTNAREGGWQQNGQPAIVHRTAFPPRLGLLEPASGVATLKLARSIRRLSTWDTVVHCGRVLPEGTAAMMAGWGNGVPYVCWTHGEELPIIAASRELRWLARRVHQRAAALVANSQHTANLLVALGHGGKVRVVRPAVDPDRFTPERRDPNLRARLLGNAEILLLSVGRLQARKGHDLALRALASLPDRARFRYVIVGDGPEAERLRELAVELGIAGQVTFTGPADADELPAYYAAADIFVHPNRVEHGDFEGFGIVFLEAAATGIPAIGGRSGGVPEAVEDGVTGLLVSGEDVVELRDAILRLARSASLRVEIGAAGRARVLREFTWERAAREVLAIDADVRTARTRPA
jgi:phosphatidylinositol alpha-1,6-mannosyltransferase